MLRNIFGLFFLLIVYGCLARISTVRAEIVINEFSPSSDTEWVELYNTSGDSIDLALWTLSDNSQPAATISGSIVGNGYFVFERAEGWLNNNGSDSITLRDNTGAVKDVVSYGSGGTVAGIPSADKSIARIPNGNGTWQNNQNWTKGTVNIGPTSAPTNTPQPSNTSVPTISPTKTPTPTILRSPTPKISKSPTPEPTEEDSELIISITPNPTPTPTPPEGNTNSNLPLVISLSLVGGGLGLISLLLIWKKRNALRIIKPELPPENDILEK